MVGAGVVGVVGVVGAVGSRVPVPVSTPPVAAPLPVPPVGVSPASRNWPHSLKPARSPEARAVDLRRIDRGLGRRSVSPGLDGIGLPLEGCHNLAEVAEEPVDGSKTFCKLERGELVELVAW